MESEGPIVAVSDWMDGVTGRISRWSPRLISVLGSYGFARSDTRQALRALFEIDAPHVVITVLNALARNCKIEQQVVADASNDFGIDPDCPYPAHPDT